MILVRNTNTYLRGEQILKNETQQVAQLQKTDAGNQAASALSRQIFNGCEEMKSYLLAYATGGSKTIDNDFESKNIVIGDGNTQDYLSWDKAASGKLDELAKAIDQYNTLNGKLPVSSVKPIPVNCTVINRNEEKPQEKIIGALNDLQQIQMLVLQNELEVVTGQGQKGLTAAK